MNRWYNFTVSIQIPEQKVECVILRRTTSMPNNRCEVDCVCKDYLTAMAQILQRRRASKGLTKYKMVMRWKGEPIDLAGQAINANFK